MASLCWLKIPKKTSTFGGVKCMRTIRMIIVSY
jgi:hypothetical protein